MTGTLDKNISEALCRANFEKIIRYIIDICELIVEDYKNNQRQLPNNENKIRSIMLEGYIKKNKFAYGMEGYRFDNEVPENYLGKGQYKGRVDIRILLKSDFEKDDAYYIIECKRLDGTTALNKQYVKEGIARFVTEKYSSYYRRNIMLGFVVKKMNVSANTRLIEQIQNSASNQQMHGVFQFTGSNKVTEKYRCVYQIQSGELELCHIFSDYSGII